MKSVCRSRSERASTGAEGTVTLSKCPACGFWTGASAASGAPRDCPECSEPLKTETMNRFYPH